jgi:trigger factor
MKSLKKIISLVLVLSLVLFAGCSGDKKAKEKEANDSTENSLPVSDFAYSDAIADNGFWKNVTALDYVELCEYSGIHLPRSAHEISADSVNSEINAILAEYATEKQIKDRAVVDGDTVNIDFVGSINGVEFEGGSTNGAGTIVTIGVTSYIDDFLEQLIGHTPGETFDIEVTFPENYGNEELNGKDAVFKTTVNYIMETTIPELTDKFVADSLSSVYGWNTVAEMEAGIRDNLQTSSVLSYLQKYIAENSIVKSVPETVMKYQEDSMINYVQSFVDYNNIDLKDFLSAYENVSNTEELLEKYRDKNTETASFYLIIQAIAEDADIKVNDDDVAEYFAEYMMIEDYSDYEELYGMPYLKLIVLNQKVLDYIKDNAVME